MAGRTPPLRPPLQVQQPERVSQLPKSMPGGVIYQVKLDGWRCLAFIDECGPILQARSHRIVSDRFPEVLSALAALPAGTVLDGEVCAVREGHFDFHALAMPPRARAVAGVAVSFQAFDLLALDGRDMRGAPLAERWGELVALLKPSSPALQPVLSTLELSEAESWLTTLAAVGVEGAVAKDLGMAYRAGRGNGWVKVRHGETEDADLVGVAGPPDRPTALRVRLADGREVVTVNIEQRRLRQALQSVASAGGTARVEVRVSGARGRHERVEFVRVRPKDA